MLRVMALGGLGEIGMNCLALEQRGEVVVVDCGVTFDDRGLGVDVVHASFDALDTYRERIAGVFLTHGHEDHIGALPYFLRRFDAPIWGTPYTLGLVRARAEEHEVLAHARLIETRPRTRYDVGSFEIEPVRVTHSIADATALAIRTDEGIVIHTGDFKFDETPVDGEAFDTERLAELADEGVALLMSDSTNIDTHGPVGPERGVGEALDRIVAGARGAVVVAVFASNVHRLAMLGRIARAHGRYVVPLGRSVQTHSRIARATRKEDGEAYLDWPSDLVWPPDRARELPKEKVLAVASGTQAEERAALARLARGEHPALDVGEGDTVVLSSRVIPGNEPRAFALMGNLLRRGCDVKSWYDDRAVHVSGHASRTEQKRMIELVRPRAFMPLHGTLHHLVRHAALAKELGVEQTQVVENGQSLVLRNGSIALGEPVKSGRVHVYERREIPPAVLRDRIAMADAGVVFVRVAVDRAGRLLGEVEITTRGVLDESADAKVLQSARAEVRAALAEIVVADDDVVIAEAARLAARRAIARVTGQKPVTIAKVARA